MNRRGFLTGLFGIGAAAAFFGASRRAEAAPLTPETLDTAAKAVAEMPGEPSGATTEGHYTGWRHRHVRRRYYRPRRRYYRRRYYRRHYYRPRYYYRPRRSYYRAYGW